MSELTMFFISQTVVITIVVMGAWGATKVQIARLEVQVAALKEDHAGLATKMHGMSRHLAELTGEMKGKNK